MNCYTTRGVVGWGGVGWGGVGWGGVGWGGVGWGGVGWGGVGCNDILELAHMVAATVNLYTWSMLR